MEKKDDKSNEIEGAGEDKDNDDTVEKNGKGNLTALFLLQITLTLELWTLMKIHINVAKDLETGFELHSFTLIEFKNADSWKIDNKIWGNIHLLFPNPWYCQNLIWLGVKIEGNESPNACEQNDTQTESSATETNNSEKNVKTVMRRPVTAHPTSSRIEDDEESTR